MEKQGNIIYEIRGLTLMKTKNLPNFIINCGSKPRFKSRKFRLKTELKVAQKLPYMILPKPE
ncbi:hypothetical protein AP285_03445 [Limnospira platensis YZ]|nr:hypothetical protein AP285_03445 [Arthrospira platensis YZ]KDR55464.1 hypothetical protein APPUASWS_022945 [Arthrospira platensis str. Paraca]BAI88637.1 hypothetical protein NIES39_A07990 [Arthrospira platensis NIES-39]